MNFPFSAVIGQESGKKAILLNLICPNIGGVLFSGDKGTAKSTLLRSASDLSPQMETITLPLGASEESLVGTYNMEKMMREGRYIYEPGVLNRAHNNILYIDEVNLLSRSLSSIIIDAASFGYYHVESAGLSAEIPARFLLFASMNPEEGGLRAQILDRFGLIVQIKGESDPVARVNIIKQRLEFEGDPLAFNRKYEAEQENLRLKIHNAHNLFPHTEISDELLTFIAQFSCEAGLKGNRGEIILTNTARAIAAQDERTIVSQDDVMEASTYVIPHRVEEKEENREKESGRPEEKDQKGIQGGEQNPKGESTAISPPESNTNPPSDPQGNELGEDQIFGIDGSFDLPPLNFTFPKTVHNSASTGKRNKTRTNMKRGRYIRFRQADGKSRDFALDATIRAAVPWQKVRKSTGGLLVIEPEDLKIKIREKRLGNSILFLVDASGSMGAARRMAETKGAIFSLLEDSYQKRDCVGMMAFRRDGTELVLNLTRSVELAHKELREMPVGGGTPLASALYDSVNYLKALIAREREIQPLLVILTDGRGNIPLIKGQSKASSRIEEEIWETARAVSNEKIQILVIDTETGWVKLNMAKKLAHCLGASYLLLEDYRSETLADSIRTFIK